MPAVVNTDTQAASSSTNSMADSLRLRWSLARAIWARRASPVNGTSFIWTSTV